MNNSELFQNLFSRVSADTGQSLQIVESVIEHQFKSAAGMIKNSIAVEISGLGHFTCSHHRLKMAAKRATRIMDSYMKRLPDCPSARLNTLQIKIESCQRLISGLQKRLLQYESRLERLAARDIQLPVGQAMD